MRPLLLSLVLFAACDGTKKSDPGGPGGGDCVEATVYDDVDHDTFGDPSTGRLGCEGDRGTVLNGDDCDDTDPRIFPLNPEICINGLDEDCDGVADDGCHVDWCGEITDDTTWESHLIHDVTCPVAVGGDAAPTLTIQDGAQVFFAPGAVLSVGEDGPAALQAEGADLGVFLSPADGETAPGSWPGVRFGALDQGSQMAGTILSSAGEVDAAIVAVGSRPTLTEVLVQDSGGAGVLASGGGVPQLISTTIERSATHGVSVAESSSAVVQDCLIADSAEHGVFVDYGGCLAYEGGFSGNTITGGGSTPVVVPGDCAGALDDTTDYTGNADDRVRLTGDQSTTSGQSPGLDWPITDTWTDPGVPFVSGALLRALRLTIEPGVEVQFEPYSSSSNVWSAIIITGSMTADGALLTSGDSAPTAGSWRGIQVGADWDEPAVLALTDTTVEWHTQVSGSGSVELQRSVLQDALGGISMAVVAQSLTLVDSTIQRLSDDQAAVRIGAFDSHSLTMSGTIITDCAGPPARIPFDQLDGIDGTNDLSGNAVDEVQLYNWDPRRSGAYIEVDTTWHDMGATWRMEDGVSFHPYSGAPQVVTFEDGVDIIAERDVAIAVGGPGDVSLVVDGHTQGVTMASAVGSAPDLWRGLWVESYDHENSRIDGLTVRDAYVGLQMGRAAPITRSTFTGNLQGLIIQGLDTLTDSVISDNVYVGFTIQMDSDIAVNPGGVARTTVTGNGTVGTVSAAVVPALDASSTFTGNDEDVISVTRAGSGGLLIDATWADLGVPYRIEDDLDLDRFTRGSWTVEPGVTIQLDPAVDIESDGLDVVLQGTASAPIVFTSSEASPAAGDWDSLWFQNCGSATLSHVEARYGGLGNGLLRFSSCDATVTDSVLSDSASYCIQTGGTSTVTVSGTTFSNCASGETD